MIKARNQSSHTYNLERAQQIASEVIHRFAPASDIDLTLLGPDLSSTTLARIDAELDDLLPPWVIDLSCHACLRHPALLDHIERDGLVLYERAGQKLDQRVAQIPPTTPTPSPLTPSPPTLQQTLPP